MGNIKFCLLLVCCFFIFVGFEQAQPEHLQTKDVTKIMQQIFSQHVDKKEITAAILKNSFKVYIDQFDPDRIYLLEQEVHPFLNISDSEMVRIMQQYKQDKFPEYTALNEVIRNAILRDQRLRSDLMKQQQNELFDKASAVKADGYEEWSDPDLKRSFAKSEADLITRIKHAIQRFIASEEKRYGDVFVKNREGLTLRLYDKQLREHEAQYLFTTAAGQSMNDVEKENAFALHVLKALSNSLDAHTSILDSTEAYDMRLRLEKEVEGIGILLQPLKNGGFVISQILAGGPAAQSGKIKLNDRLLEIDGVVLTNKTINEVMGLVRGKVGTPAKLVLQRMMEENNHLVAKTFNVELVRQEIIINEDRVQSSFEPFGNGIIGKIKLDSFYSSDNGISSEIDMRAAIKKLDKQGNLRGLILDFRENSGGFLAQAIKVAGLFITNGVVVISKYFSGEEHVYRDMDGKLAYEGPLIILTSKATASAAEIVAQALQDYGVAVIVGDEHTYGKGTIQSQTVTENQAATYFKVTVGKYYTVSGKTPQIQGVKADVVVPSQFYHENIGEEFLNNSLKGDQIAASYDDNLKDISPNLRPWYMHYYLPTVQHRQTLTASILPAVKKNSQARIANNKLYQQFLQGNNSSEAIRAWKQQEKNGADDLQMSEAISVMKDIVTLEAQERHTDLDAKTVAYPDQKK